MLEFMNCVACGRSNQPVTETLGEQVVLACPNCGELVEVPEGVEDVRAWNRRQIILRRDVYREALLKVGARLAAVDHGKHPRERDPGKVALDAQLYARELTRQFAPLSPHDDSRPPLDAPLGTAAPSGRQKTKQLDVYFARGVKPNLKVLAKLAPDKLYGTDEMGPAFGMGPAWFGNIMRKHAGHCPVPLVITGNGLRRRVQITGEDARKLADLITQHGGF